MTYFIYFFTNRVHRPPIPHTSLVEISNKTVCSLAELKSSNPPLPPSSRLKRPETSSHCSLRLDQLLDILGHEKILIGPHLLHLIAVDLLPGHDLDLVVVQVRKTASEQQHVLFQRVDPVDSHKGVDLQESGRSHEADLTLQSRELGVEELAQEVMPVL